MTKGGDILDVAHQTEGLVVVLADLVISIAKTCLGNGHLGQRPVALGLHQNPGNRLAGTVEQRL